MKEFTFDIEMVIANLHNIKKVIELINERREMLLLPMTFFTHRME